MNKPDRPAPGSCLYPLIRAFHAMEAFVPAFAAVLHRTTPERPTSGQAVVAPFSRQMRKSLIVREYGQEGPLWVAERASALR
jgi:hypothetical protein